MKKLLLLSIIGLFVLTASAQYQNVYKVSTKAETFKIPVRVNELVYEVDSSAIYKLTSGYSIGYNMDSVFSDGNYSVIATAGNVVSATDYTTSGNISCDTLKNDVIRVASNNYTLMPQITVAAADTTGIAPAKIGDIYIDTANGNAYIGITAAVSGWKKLN